MEIFHALHFHNKPFHFSRGVCEAQLLQADKPCFIGAIPTKTYWRPPAHIPLGL